MVLNLSTNGFIGVAKSERQGSDGKVYTEISTVTPVNVTCPLPVYISSVIRRPSYAETLGSLWRR